MTSYTQTYSNHTAAVNVTPVPTATPLVTPVVSPTAVPTVTQNLVSPTLALYATSTSTAPKIVVSHKQEAVLVGALGVLLLSAVAILLIKRTIVKS